VIADASAWLEERGRAHHYDIQRIPLADVERWHLGDDLAHDTRRYFTVEGLSIETNFGRVAKWTQPIIHQPEIGILGFLAKRVDGELHLLAQAKMEPGNRRMVQLTPTVQATPSNYTRVHGGRSTPFLDRFLAPTRGRVLVDLLLSEQGTRYYHKRNRNMIVEIDDDPPIGPDFAWVTLDQLRGLFREGSAINMNARTVLSTLHHDPADASDEELARTLSWLSDRKTEMSLDVKRIKLGELDQWICDRESIRRPDGRFFRVIGVSISSAGSREVSAWRQPMFEPVHLGTIMFVRQLREGRMEYLVQARAEAGFIDTVELGATVQMSAKNYARKEDMPPFAELVDAPAEWVRFRSPQADDGGRFFHDEAMHVVVELPESERIDVPPNFTWVTLPLLRRLMRCGYVVDIEARSLLACVS
jgi:oxidase EvaA